MCWLTLQWTLQLTVNNRAGSLTALVGSGTKSSEKPPYPQYIQCDGDSILSPDHFVPPLPSSLTMWSCDALMRHKAGHNPSHGGVLGKLFCIIKSWCCKSRADSRPKSLRIVFLLQSPGLGLCQDLGRRKGFHPKIMLNVCIFRGFVKNGSILWTSTSILQIVCQSSSVKAWKVMSAKWHFLWPVQCNYIFEVTPICHDEYESCHSTQPGLGAAIQSLREA